MPHGFSSFCAATVRLLYDTGIAHPSLTVHNSFFMMVVRKSIRVRGARLNSDLAKQL